MVIHAHLEWALALCTVVKLPLDGKTFESLITKTIQPSLSLTPSNAIKTHSHLPIKQPQTTK